MIPRHSTDGKDIHGLGESHDTKTEIRGSRIQENPMVQIIKKKSQTENSRPTSNPHYNHQTLTSKAYSGNQPSPNLNQPPH